MAKMNDNADPRSNAFAVLAKGLRDVGEGRKLTDQGRGGVVVGMLMAAKAVAADADEYRRIIWAAQGIHADRKEQQEWYSGAWAFWKDQAMTAREDAKIKSADALRLDKYRSEDNKKGEVGNLMQANAPISSREQAIMFATTVLVAFDATKIDWSKIGFHNVSTTMDADTANKLFANSKKDKTIKAMSEAAPLLSVGVYGQLRYSTLAEYGAEWLRANNIKPRPANRNSNVQALRDKAKDLVKLIDGDDKTEGADAKAYDMPADDNALLQVVMSAVNALSDGTLNKFRFTKAEAEEITRICETARERAIEHAKKMQQKQAA